MFISDYTQLQYVRPENEVSCLFTKPLEVTILGNYKWMQKCEVVNKFVFNHVDHYHPC